MWKERLWQMFLVAILGLVLTMCSRSGGNNNTSSSGILNADGTSTVSVSSLPSITLANAGLNAISHTMLCLYIGYSSEVMTYMSCDSSDDTVLSSGNITHDAALAAGWKLFGSGCSSGNTGSTGAMCALFHK